MDLPRHINVISDKEDNHIDNIVITEVSDKEKRNIVRRYIPLWVVKELKEKYVQKSVQSDSILTHLN